MSAAHTVISPSIPENGSKIVEYFVIGPARDLSHAVIVCHHICSDEEDGEFQPARGEVDTSYSDPLGPPPDRLCDCLYIYYEQHVDMTQAQDECRGQTQHGRRVCRRGDRG